MLILWLSWAAGVGIGLMFFGGLWWTVRRGLTSGRPALVFGVSMLVRTSLALASLYLVSAGQWERLLACLVGFVTARLIVTRVTRGAGTLPPRTAEEARHAPQP
ncbi:MAG: ATP synthase subunit I [Acidobacteria bacterium]|nr:ATP synthase subunit I [Acidobacteriota bacterium]